MEYWNPMVPELIVSNFKNSKRFYTDIIGFKVRYERGNPEFAYLELGRIQIMIEQCNDECWKTGELEHPYGRGINFQMELDDIQPIYESLKSKGYDLFREIKESTYQSNSSIMRQLEFLVQDPDGYLLRFTEFLSEENT